MSGSSSSSGRVIACLVLLALVGVAHSHGHHHGRELVASLADEAGPWNSLKLLLGTKVGEARAGVAALKDYLYQFGYIPETDHPPAGTPFTDTFDAIASAAVSNYQRSFGLPATGSLDVATLTQMIIPRCGRKDVFNGTLVMLQTGLMVGTQRWSAFAGNPRWTKKSLTYRIEATALSPAVSLTDTEIAVDTAFALWAQVTNLTFTRTQAAVTDITISFGLLEHGDGNPFDGHLGVLAHAFAPESGRLHFDKAESWSVNIQQPTSASDVDLVSVAVHEIGHLIGLEHSSVAGAIMYPSITLLTSKQVLHEDDILGAQALYGANPTYTPGSAPPGTNSNIGAAVASWRRLRAMDVVLSCLGLLLAASQFE